MICFDQMVQADSWARIVDVFVVAMDMASLGFKNTNLKDEGNTLSSSRHIQAYTLCS